MRMLRCSASFALGLGLLTACAQNRVISTPAPTPSPGSEIRFASKSNPRELIRARVLSLDADSLAYASVAAGAPTGWTHETIPTDSIAVLQVHVGRRGNAGGGALIGGLVGLGIGALCEAQPNTGSMAEPPSGSCLMGSTLMGAGTGALIGLLVKSDVWAPTTPPPPRPGMPPAPAVGTLPSGVEIRLPVTSRGG
jgi:hypothetical protein